MTINRVYKVFELVKKAKRKKFSEKSYFYRKDNGLPPTESDNDPNSAGEDKAQAHGFKEPKAEEEDDHGAVEDVRMDMDTDEV